VEKITSTKLIIKACDELGLKYSYGSKDKVVITIHYLNFNHLIINFNLGLITGSLAHLCLDKAYQVEFFKDQINIPKTNSYLDPQGKYSSMGKHNHVKNILKNIKEKFSFPIIIKKNKGSEGEGVFLSHNDNQLINAVRNTFDHKNKDYDYVLIAQQYIRPKAEYRAVFYKQKLEILYRKNNDKSTFTGNLSPLHFEGSTAVDITDKEKIKKITNFIKPIFKKINLEYAGFDIIEDKNKKLWLIEINSAPAYVHYLENNSDDKVIKLFKKILSDLNKQ
jgi:glutathione synthase/RimK-type ligase-like ATP-grasp enzyme